jgi:hypothetical protein
VVAGLVWSVAVAAGGGVAAATYEDDDPADPYVEALTDDSIDELAEQGAEVGDDEEAAVRCFSEAVVDVVTVARLEELEVSPELLAEADTLAGIEVSLDEAALATLIAEASACEVLPVLAHGFAETGLEQFQQQAGVLGIAVQLSDTAEACLADVAAASPGLADLFVRGYAGTISDEEAAPRFAALVADGVAGCPAVLTEVLTAGLESQGLVVSDATRACVEAQLLGRRDAIRAALDPAGPGIGGLATEMAGAVADCPAVIVEPLATALDQAGTPPGPSGRACLEAEAAARPDALAAAFADPAAAAELGGAIVEACLASFDG